MRQFDMTDDEVKEARWASREVAKHLDGVKLIDGLRIGEALLKGRHYAMKASGTNKPIGKDYAEAFRDWKQAFRFRGGREAENYYDAAIICAQHRSIADDIIGVLSVKQKAEMGVFGLAKRVRAKVRELEGLPKKPAKLTVESRIDHLAGRLADMEERVIASQPKSAAELVELLAQHEAAEVLEVLRLHHRAWLERLLEAARDAAEEEPT